MNVEALRALEKAVEAGEFYICDLRQSWAKQWAVTFWRPDNAGYAYPLSWAGKYDKLAIENGGDYYFEREAGKMTRFPVPCDIADALATPSPPGKIDGDAGPVVLNTPKNRAALRKAGRALILQAEAKGVGE